MRRYEGPFCQIYHPAERTVIVNSHPARQLSLTLSLSLNIPRKAVIVNVNVIVNYYLSLKSYTHMALLKST